MYIQTYNRYKVPSGIQNLVDGHPVTKLIVKEVKDKIEKFLQKKANGDNPREPDFLKYKAIWLDDEGIKITRKYVNAQGKLSFSFNSPDNYQLKFVFIRPLKDRAEDIKTAKAEVKAQKERMAKIEEDAKNNKT